MFSGIRYGSAKTYVRVMRALGLWGEDCAGLGWCGRWTSAEHGFALPVADSLECAHLKTSCVSCVVLGEVKVLSIVMDRLKLYFLLDEETGLLETNSNNRKVPKLPNV